MTDQTEEEYEVQYINNHKIVTGKNKKKELYFEIKWKGYPASENTWEPSESTDNAKDLVDQYWAIKGGGKEARIRVEKILKGETDKKKNEEVDEDDDDDEEDKPRMTRSSKKKTAPIASKKNQTASKRRKVENKEIQSDEEKKIGSDSENDDYSESEIEKKNFRLKSNWKSNVAKIIEVRSVVDDNGNKELFGLVRWRDGKLGLYKTEDISKRVPDKLIKYYENVLSFEQK